MDLPAGLEIVEWADDLGSLIDVADSKAEPHAQLLSIELADLESRMLHSVATGRGLVSNGDLGVDLIQVSAGNGFTPHTHPGDHILIVVAGQGTITFGGGIYPTHAGQVYMVDGDVPHAVGAITTHLILAVGSPHKPVDGLERMTPTEYTAIATDLDRTLTCFVCDPQVTVFAPDMLHGVECPHCPCKECVPPVTEPLCLCPSCT